MELPLGKGFESDRSEPLDSIVRASLGIDHDTVPHIDGGKERTVFAFTGKFKYPIDVLYEVTKGKGLLNYFDKDGKFLRNEPLELGSHGTLLADEYYEYITTDGHMVVLQSYDGEDEEALALD
jgi:hypothetical protein